MNRSDALVRVVAWVVIGVGTLVVIGGISNGCSSDPVQQVNAPLPPEYGGFEVCSWCDPLAEALCQMYGACGVLRVAVNQGGAAAEPTTLWDSKTGAPINAKMIEVPCLDNPPRECYWIYIFGIRYWYCTAGNCPAEEQPS